MTTHFEKVELYPVYLVPQGTPPELCDVYLDIDEKTLKQIKRAQTTFLNLQKKLKEAIGE